MALEVYGVMMHREQERRISENFQTMDFFVDCSEFDRFTGQKYENILKFQVSNSNIDRLDSIKDGDKVKITFRPKGRYYERDGEQRHFQTLEAWKVELVQQ